MPGLSIRHDKKISGFSLIELMIVISIIGMLTTIAIPSYKNYTLRARFTEIILATDIFKTAVALALQENVPMDELVNGAHGIPLSPKATQHLSSIKVEKGIITALGSALVNYQTYILKPNEDGSLWSVSGTCVKSGLCRVA